MDFFEGLLVLMIATICANAQNDCVCVPYYQCDDTGNVITDGSGMIDPRILKGTNNKTQCDSFLEVCCRLNSSVVKPEKIGCGLHNPRGTPGEFGGFPWTVGILTENTRKTHDSYVCGGSLVHPKVVITAAHCVLDQKQKYTIRTGARNHPYQIRNVGNVTIHPKYREDTRTYNDIAFLVLEQPVDLVEGVNVICLPPQGVTVENSSCFSTNRNSSVTLPIIKKDQCQKTLQKTRLGVLFELHDSYVCAGGEQDKDTCKGDGGSPLVCPMGDSKEKYQQIGIVSWGVGCGRKIPGIYTNVALFRDWIDAQMKINDLEKSSYEF